MVVKENRVEGICLGGHSCISGGILAVGYLLPICVVVKMIVFTFDSEKDFH